MTNLRKKSLFKLIVIVALLGAVYAQNLTYDYSLEPSSDATQQIKIKYLLDLVNRVRAAQPNVTLSPLVIDFRLNEIAQKHSEDMVARNFFDHTNPDGKGPSDRALAANFTSPVGENIVATTNLTQCHINLMNSPPHFRNTNFDFWSRVGFGIKFYKNYWYQIYYVTVLFSIRDFNENPITAAQYELKKTEMKTYIESVNPGKTQIPELSTYIKSWLDQGQTGKLYDYLDAKKYKYNQNLIYYTSPAYWTSSLIPTYRNRKAFVGLRSFDNKYAVGMKVDNITQTTTVVAFSP